MKWFAIARNPPDTQFPQEGFGMFVVIAGLLVVVGGFYLFAPTTIIVKRHMGGGKNVGRKGIELAPPSRRPPSTARIVGYRIAGLVTVLLGIGLICLELM